MNKKKISFCCTCFKRYPQLKKTLPKNLKVLSKFEDVEFCLVHFVQSIPFLSEPESAMHQWLIDNFQHFVNSGQLRYVLSEELQFWHAPIAKNIAHDCSTSEFLINTDCDNYISKNEVSFLLKTDLNNSIYHGWSGKWRDGTYGNIGMPTKIFKRLGGYDESFEPHGAQDNDLLKRAIAITGSQPIRFTKRKAILNSKEDGLRYTNSTLKYDQMRDANTEKSKANLSEGRLIRERLHEEGIRKVQKPSSD